MKTSILLLGALLLMLAGCTIQDATPMPTKVGHLELIQEDRGWVQVRVTGVTEPGFTIWWGDDMATSYGQSSVNSWEELYAHFYQPVPGGASGEQIPTEYQIILRDPVGSPVAQQAVQITTSNCYLELIAINGGEVLVQYWGRFGIQYSISWGDGFADHVIASVQSGKGIASHTYSQLGSYILGMEEIWAPREEFFTLTID